MTAATAPRSRPAPARLRHRGTQATTNRPGRSEFRDGVVQMLPFVIGYVPFALLVGVTIGRSTDPVAGWTATMPLYGGSPQLTLLELLADGAAAWTAAGAALLINSRLLVYSAALLPLFGTAPLRTRLFGATFVVDPTWMLALRRGEAPGDLEARRRHYAGTAAALTVGWLVAVTAGVLLGRVETPVLGVVGPLCILALVVPHLRLPGGLAAVGAAAVVTVVTASLALPAGTGPLAAMAAAAGAGLLTARRRTER